MVKYFCDVCGKEVNRVHSVPIGLKLFDMCPICYTRLNKQREQAQKNVEIKFIKSKGEYCEEVYDEN